jgi:hypothetical protein
MLLLVLCLFVPLFAKEVQLIAPNETLTGYWPGDMTMTDQERCSIAITKSKVFRIIGFNNNPKSQTLPTNTTAAAVVYNAGTTAYWLLVADNKGTITSMFSDINCQTPFRPEWDYPVFKFPGTQWDSAVTRLNPNRAGQTTATFIGDNLMVEFSFYDETGQPYITNQLKVPWTFDTTPRTVVGFGDALPFPGSSKPSIAVARQDQTDSKGTGELVLIDPSKKSPPVIRYFPNLRGWQSTITKSGVSAIALIDPSEGESMGYILGYAPGQDQPQTIPFPFNATERWSTGASWVVLSDQTSGLGIFLVGEQAPGGPTYFRFVSQTNGNFQLLPTTLPLTSDSSTWISDTPSFISAPTTFNNVRKYLYVSAQRIKGPVVFQVPFPKLSTLLRPGGSRTQTHLLQRQKRSVLCNSSEPCKTLTPAKSCSSDPACCQTYLPPGGSRFMSACCQDCNLGNCVGNPGQCVI